MSLPSPTPQDRQRLRLVIFGAGLAVAGALLLAAAAQLALPLRPVPLTLHSLALLWLAGRAGGPTAAAAALIYLGAVGAGAPVLAQFARAPAGILALGSAGYLMSFVPAAWLGGAALRRARGRFGALVLAGLFCHAVILACGALWLAQRVGVTRALQAQVPLLPGAVLKSLAAAALLRRP